MRRVWFSKPMSTGADAGADEDFDSPFLLVIEYLHKNGRYGLRARIQPSTVEVAALIEAHRLRAIQIYTDRDAEAVAERQNALNAEAWSKFEADGLAYIWGCKWLWDLARQSAICLEKSRVVSISFGSLLGAGIEVKGGREELSWLAHQLQQAVDRLWGQMHTAGEFEGNATHVFAPGAKVRPVKGPKGPEPLKPI